MKDKSKHHVLVTVNAILLVSFVVPSPILLHAQEVSLSPEPPASPTTTVQQPVPTEAQNESSPAPVQKQESPFDLGIGRERSQRPPRPVRDPIPRQRDKSKEELPSDISALATADRYEYERHPINTRIAISADESSGAFTTSIPIKTPLGRKGVQPSLSLSYNSYRQEDINIAGFGWTIDIPSIERINKRGVEGLFTQFDFRSSLDGELGRKASATTTEDYGAKVENGAFRAYEYKSHAWWKVTDKTGTIYTFGTSTLSRLDDPNDSTKVYRWMLERVEDPNGNYMTYEYTKDKGQVYPSKIKYTGKSTDQGIFEVEFLKETRSDIATSTATGFAVVSRYRINEIQTKVNNSWIHKYELGYTTGDNGVRSLLSSITETGRDETTGATIALPATQFSYQASIRSMTEDTGYSTSTMPNFISLAGFDNGVRIAEVNGDGLPDIIYAHESGSIWRIYTNDGDGTGWTQDTGYSTTSLPYFISLAGYDNGVRAIDVNGDGFDDLIRSHESGSDWRIFINNTDGTGWTKDTGYSTTSLPHFITAAGNDNGVRIVDVNGDGLADLFHSHASTPVRKIYLNDGDGTGWTQDTNYALSNLPYFLDNASNDDGVRMIDINGDGLPDIIRKREFSDNNRIFINDGDGTGWTEATSTATTTIPNFASQNGYDEGVRFADINGDGLTDVIQAHESGGRKHVYFNDGDGTGWTEVQRMRQPQYPTSSALRATITQSALPT